mgnify:CR=1 FL=1
MTMKAQVLSIFGTKGGVGKTFIATNLAATLRLQSGFKIALLILDSAKTDASLMLGTTEVSRVDGPQKAQELPSVIANLCRTHSYVLIDAGSVLSELAAAAFERSNLILLVITPDVVAVRHTHRTLEMFESLKLPLGMVKMVINRAESRGNFRSREVKDQFPISVIAEIPSDGRLAGLSMNQGIPVVTFGESSRLKEAFKRLATSLMEHPEWFLRQATLDSSMLGSIVQPPVEHPKSLIQGLPAASDGEQHEDTLRLLKRRIHSRLIERFDLKRLDLTSLTLNNPAMAKQLKERVEQLTLELLTEETGLVPDMEQRARLVKEIVDEILGLGPLEALMQDDEISDILVNGKDTIYVERHGKLFLTGRRFLSNDQLIAVIERIVAPLGRRVDESNPMVDARLPDGSRVNAIIPPLSVAGPMLSIRKFMRGRYTAEDLIRLGTLTPSMATFLDACVRARKNIIISGGAGSGKTTVLNALSASLPEGERIITIEDAAELRLRQQHWIPLESRPPNIEGKGAVTIRQIFRNALRMRPDRIVIGECRGDETLDMLQAMNTGHEGSLTTIHANSPQDVVTRLDALVLMSNLELPVRAIREQIISAIDLIVHTARLSDGSRKITHITELSGTEDRVSFEDIFIFRQHGVDPRGQVLGGFQPTKYRPSFLEELKAKGYELDETIFDVP